MLHYKINYSLATTFQRMCQTEIMHLYMPTNEEKTSAVAREKNQRDGRAIFISSTLYKYLHIKAFIVFCPKVSSSEPSLVLNNLSTLELSYWRTILKYSWMRRSSLHQIFIEIEVEKCNKSELCGISIYHWQLKPSQQNIKERQIAMSFIVQHCLEIYIFSISKMKECCLHSYHLVAVVHT